VRHFAPLAPSGSTVRAFANDHADVRQPLFAWFDEVEGANWGGPDDVKTRYPSASDPIEAIRFRMEQEGLTTKDLLPIFKTRARASEVMAKKRRLNLVMIRRLHARLAIPIECLVQDYRLKGHASGSRSRHR
jgi:hypothetical protein